MNPKQKFLQNNSGIIGTSTAPLFNKSSLTIPKKSNILSGIKLPPTTTKVNSGLTQGNQPVVNTMISSNAGATGTAPTQITPPKSSGTSLPPSGQAYVKNQMATSSNGLSTIPGPYDPATGMLKETPAPTPTPTPTTPTPTQAPSQKDAYIKAYKSYIDSLKESADITEAKKVYNDYVANIAKSKAGLEGQGRGIPLNLVRGQQAQLLAQTQPELARLQGEIGIAQNAQKATQESLLAGVDLEGKLLDETQPVEVGGVLYQKGEDGQYTPLTGTGSQTEGFTLGKDQTRFEYDPSTGQYVQVAGNAGGGSGAGGDQISTAYADAVLSGKTKLENIPEEYRGSVALEIAGKEVTQETSPYLAQIAVQGRQAVKGLLDIATKNPGIFGRSAAVPFWPDSLRGDDFRNYEAQLDYLRGNLIPASLTAMREASKTGGALGQVSDREGAWLASALGALSMTQSAGAVQQQLRLIDESLSRWEQAVQQYGGTSGGQTEGIDDSFFNPANFDN